MSGTSPSPKSRSPQSLERLCASEPETLTLAAALARTLEGGELICLDGPLGAGKTRFVQGLARGLGQDASAVGSPTFIICRRHDGGRLGLAHIDAFRLQGPEELESIGWDELIDDPRLVVAVEWSRRIATALPEDRIVETAVEPAQHDESEPPETLQESDAVVAASASVMVHDLDEAQSKTLFDILNRHGIPHYILERADGGIHQVATYPIDAELAETIADELKKAGLPAYVE